MYNRQRIPDERRMQPGMKVLVPARGILEDRFAMLIPGLKPARAVDPPVPPLTKGGPRGVPPGLFVAADGRPMYRVGPADTLGEIARRHLGRSTRWPQILELNRDRLTNPQSLKIGMELRLPADASRVRVVHEDKSGR
ncbi:MAG: LysM peptidoglycan-binding domain-containing protein [Planctomycetes bacterium]|nr:LysM peptidoglycan-binding domain-containing protein [Planctomycetota bacterium]